jgi:putative MATE family efflux protein
MDMTEGTIWKQLVLFALPLLAGNVFQQLYNTVDSIVVGNFVGADALGAVTSVAPAINTLVGLFMGMSSGASVVISQFFGARNNAQLRKSVHTSIVTTTLLAFVFMLVGYYMTPPMLRFMKTPDSITPLATTYLRIYFLGILGLMIYNMGSAILRAVGDSRRPLYFLILTSIMNVILDLLFVIVFHLGVAGVAYATIISQFVSAILIMIVLFRSQECYSLRWNEMKIDQSMLGRIVYIGLPAGLQMAITSFSNVFVQSYINNFGAASTSGWGAYGRIDSFVILPMQSLALAATTFVGQNAGAGRVERIRTGIRTTLTLAIACTLAVCIPEFIIAPHVISLFSRDPQVMYYGALFIRLNCLFDVLCCMNQVHAGALRGMGDAKVPMFIMLGSFVVFRQIYLFIMSHLTGSIYPIALGYPAGWLVCSILMFLYFHYSHWDQKISRSTL